MADIEKVIKGLKCCSNCSGEDCNKCPYQNEAKGEAPTCTAHLSNDALSLLKEQEELINNLEQEIRDKNERLKERAQQVDTMLKEQEAVEPITDSARNRRCQKCNTILKGKFCHECGQAVKWDG